MTNAVHLEGELSIFGGEGCGESGHGCRDDLSQCLAVLVVEGRSRTAEYVRTEIGDVRLIKFGKAVAAQGAIRFQPIMNRLPLTPGEVGT